MNDVLTSPLLAGLPGFEHGFGMRDSNLSQSGMASLKQVHSARIMTGTGPGEIGEADALVSATPGLAISIRTADCYPILIADPQRRAVAAIHAGWRGTAAQIVKQTITEMHRQFGTKPEDIFAAVGPGIGVCCYRVGEVVGRQFGLNSAGNLDLAQINRDQLIQVGIPESQIEVLGLCTFCDARFFSYRREGERAGRMISFITLAA